MRHPRPLPSAAVAATLVMLFASGTVRAQPRNPVGQNDRDGDGTQRASRTVDTHMHLHPTGLDQALRGGGRGSSPARGRGRSGGDANANLAQAASALVARMDELGVHGGFVRKHLVDVGPAARRPREEESATRTPALSTNSAMRASA